MDLSKGDFVKNQDVSCLTEREREVLYWIYFGKTNWEISEILGISKHTVKNHVKNILKKMGVNNRTHAASRACSFGFLELSCHQKNTNNMTASSILANRSKAVVASTL